MGSCRLVRSLHLFISLLTLVECFQSSTNRCTRRKLPALQSTFDGSAGTTTRRDVLVQSASLALSGLLVGQPATAAGAPLNIVMTGANSGIGFESCKQLAAQGHSIVLACRTLAKAQDAVQRIRDAGVTTGNLSPAECDLASLESIQKFASTLSVSSIDALALNAGLSRNTAATDCARTADGFELTVGTNHFGHFYLNSLLLPKVAKDGKIVVTASGVHDPESPGGAQGVPAHFGDMKGLETEGRYCEMIDGSPFNADKAYKDSKLANVLFTRELQKRLERQDSTKGITANCFNPGLIVSTGLFRDQNPLFTKVFDFAATDLLKVGETPPWGGGCLTYMINTVVDRGAFYSSPPGSSKYGEAAYGKQFAASPVSKEARDDAKATKFWELTEKALQKVV